MNEGQGFLIPFFLLATLLLGAPFEAKRDNQYICFPSFSWLLEYILPPEAWGVLSRLWASQVSHTCFCHPCSSLDCSLPALHLRAHAFSVLNPQWELRALLSG